MQAPCSADLSDGTYGWQNASFENRIARVQSSKWWTLVQVLEVLQLLLHLWRCNGAVDQAEVWVPTLSLQKSWPVLPDSQDPESVPQDQIALLAAASKKRKPLLALPAVESEAPKPDCSKPVGQREAKPALVQEPKAKKQKGSGAEQVPKELKEKSGAEQILKGLKEKLEEKKMEKAEKPQAKSKASAKAKAKGQKALPQKKKKG